LKHATRAVLGHVTGAHLHYEILAHGIAIDPGRLIARQPAAKAAAG
jgi:murein DD-endopeptidase MepM/ murein hydrolase activator NlpD